MHSRNQMTVIADSSLLPRTYTYPLGLRSRCSRLLATAPAQPTGDDGAIPHTAVCASPHRIARRCPTVARLANRPRVSRSPLSLAPIQRRPPEESSVLFQRTFCTRWQIYSISSLFAKLRNLFVLFLGTGRCDAVQSKEADVTYCILASSFILQGWMRSHWRLYRAPKKSNSNLEIYNYSQKRSLRPARRLEELP